jgi:hypothetical protein
MVLLSLRLSTTLISFHREKRDIQKADRSDSTDIEAVPGRSAIAFALGLAGQAKNRKPRSEIFQGRVTGAVVPIGSRMVGSTPSMRAKVR